MDPKQRFIQTQPINFHILNRIPLSSQQRSAILGHAQFFNFCTQNWIQLKGLKLRKSMAVNWKFVNVQYRNKMENEWNRALFDCSTRLTAFLRRQFTHVYSSSQNSIDYHTKRTVYTEQLRNLQLYPNRRAKPLRPRFIPTYAQRKIEHSTDITLTEEQDELLQLSLGYSINTRVDRFSLATQLQNVASKMIQPISESDKPMFNTLFARRIWNPYIKKGVINKHSCNLPRHLQRALKELRSNKNYVIKRADKAGQAIIWKSSVPIYIHAGSGHPTSMKREMVYGEALRMSRNCDQDVDFKKCMCDLTSTLFGRGYESRTIIKQINRARNRRKFPRNTNTKNSDAYHSVIVPFHPWLTGFRKDIKTMSRYVNNLLSMVGTTCEKTQDKLLSPNESETERQMFFNDGEGSGFQPISADRIDATSHSQKNPPTLPRERIKVVYHDTDSGLSTRFSGKVGRLKKQQAGEEIAITDIFDFQPIGCPPIVPPKNSKSEEEIPFLAIIVYMLLNVRIGKLDPITGSDYAQGLAGNLKVLMGQIPFDCSTEMIDRYPFRLELLVHRQSYVLKKLAASINYFMSNTQCGELLKIRYSTITTRYENLPFSNMSLRHTIIKRPAKEMFEIFNSPDEVSNTCSMLPYSRSLDLISKSQYSLNESHGLITTFIAFLDLLGKHKFLNVARCDVDVNTYLMLAVKINSCIGTTTEIGEYFYTSEEARSGMAAPIQSKGMILRDEARLLIRKIQSQQSILSRRDILLPKNAAIQIAQPRRGSLAEYIRGLPLELEMPPNLRSDEFATYDQTMITTPQAIMLSNVDEPNMAKLLRNRICKNEDIQKYIKLQPNVQTKSNLTNVERKAINELKLLNHL
ncbi:hypothetical protein GJ496_010485, partial [Pomphorhynchus laevis]